MDVRERSKRHEEGKGRGDFPALAMGPPGGLDKVAGARAETGGFVGQDRHEG